MGKWSYGFRYSRRITQCSFFYNGKNFCLTGGAEHRNLKLSQIKKKITIVDGKMVNSYVYQEFRSKKNQSGFSSLGATTLFQSGVSEKLIQQRTGHRLTYALRQYERTSESQLVEVSNILSGEQSDEQQHRGKEEASKVCPWFIQTQSMGDTKTQNSGITQ